MSILAPLAGPLGLAGAGISALGAIEGGEANAANANYQSQVAKNNQIIAEQNANYASAAGQAQATNEGLKGAATSGKIKASIAANGVDVNTGSAAAVQTSQAETNELNTANVLNNSALQVYGYRSQAANYGAQAAAEQAQAQQAPIAGDLGAVGSLLGGASSVGFKWASL